MARAPSCYKRANCVQICASLIGGLPVELVRTQVLPALLPLTADRVANVRLALATLVKSRLLTEGSPYAAEPLTLQLLEALRADVDRDVLRAAHPEGFEPPPYKCKPPPPPNPMQAAYAAAEAAGNCEIEGVDDADLADFDAAYAAAIAGEPAMDAADAAADAEEDAVGGDDPLANDVADGLKTLRVSAMPMAEPDVGARAV